VTWPELGRGARVSIPVTIGMTWPPEDGIITQRFLKDFFKQFADLRTDHVCTIFFKRSFIYIPEHPHLSRRRIITDVIPLRTEGDNLKLFDEL
jgi:hypothetical protein